MQKIIIGKYAQKEIGKLLILHPKIIREDRNELFKHDGFCLPIALAILNI
jgi:hypothetical protein